MSNEPNVEDLRRGVEGLTLAVNDLETFATSVSQRQPGRDGFGVSIIEEICARIGDQGDGHPLSKVTANTNQCNEAAKKLERYRDYAREARYCIEASLQAAHLCAIAQEFAIYMHAEIERLRKRAFSRNQGRWTRNDESRFWRDRNSFDSIAAQFTSVPNLPDNGDSCEPWREETQADRALKNFLELCQRISAHQRTIIYGLEMMAEEMARKYDRE